MPWWLAVLNSLLGVVSAGFGAVAVIRPQTLAPLLGHGGKGGRFYPAMYAARGIPFGEVFSPDAFVEGEDDQGCGGDRGDGSGIEGDVREGLEVLDQGVGPLGGSPH